MHPKPGVNQLVIQEEKRKGGGVLNCINKVVERDSSLGFNSDVQEVLLTEIITEGLYTEF